MSKKINSFPKSIQWLFLLLGAVFCMVVLGIFLRWQVISNGSIALYTDPNHPAIVQILQHSNRTLLLEKSRGNVYEVTDSQINNVFSVGKPIAAAAIDSSGIILVVGEGPEYEIQEYTGTFSLIRNFTISVNPITSVVGSETPLEILDNHLVVNGTFQFMLNDTMQQDITNVGRIISGKNFAEWDALLKPYAVATSSSFYENYPTGPETVLAVFPISKRYDAIVVDQNGFLRRKKDVFGNKGSEGK